jgi:hypothetical protein
MMGRASWKLAEFFIGIMLAIASQRAGGTIFALREFGMHSYNTV